VNDRSASQVRARFTGRASSPIMTPSAPRHGCTNSDFSHFKETGARPANAAGLHNFSELQVRTVDGTAGVAAYRRPGSCSVRSRRYRAARLTDVRRTRRVLAHATERSILCRHARARVRRTRASTRARRVHGYGVPPGRIFRTQRRYTVLSLSRAVRAGSPSRFGSALSGRSSAPRC
jgi:hypothetical protein